MARKHLVDVTEIFRQLNGEKKYRMIKLAFYFCLFIITIYRFDVWILWLANSL
jgi:protein cornichon